MAYHLSTFQIQQPLSYILYHLRRNDNGCLLERPSVKVKKTLGDRAFQAAVPFLWNKLPRSAHVAMNLESFKTLIQTFLFKESFNYFYFDRKICKILVINCCCDALLNILQKRCNINNVIVIVLNLHPLPVLHVQVTCYVHGLAADFFVLRLRILVVKDVHERLGVSRSNSRRNELTVLIAQTL